MPAGETYHQEKNGIKYKQVSENEYNRLKATLVEKRLGYADYNGAKVGLEQDAFEDKLAFAFSVQ